MVIGLAALVMILGLIIYLLAKAPESQRPGEVGRIMFAFGLLALLLNGDKVAALFVR